MIWKQKEDRVASKKATPKAIGMAGIFG